LRDLARKEALIGSGRVSEKERLENESEPGHGVKNRDAREGCKSRVIWTVKNHGRILKQYERNSWLLSFDGNTIMLPGEKLVDAWNKWVFCKMARMECCRRRPSKIEGDDGHSEVKVKCT
jgi:hypothetical protein